ncbi:J domain-containing protein [Ralstonia solanacearum]|uniref:Molecular chaperone DnaJ n=1 Tax=Ralstonia solanacearum K60 TaxID=1091042 RepID=A0AAP7ZLJ9_RALSL|nr:J domain-containing protein [Ralstonia solanacearum]MBT1537238.1 J domain-containing protein [Ralstonia solanacearum]OYQ12791.1 molecular chaperone DnaJ [Ralstonia solanacearum K60]QOK83135.1 molecular chaperone DnaJ [Ralstonia solanacearum]RIJ87535.1 molecular chaperone DnaJ [Ralstonia solanacearum]CCF97090.1 conserved hypothetical protein [Ralstonia solanacearum K60]
MTKVIRQAVGILPEQDQTNLSKGQKAFNSLIRRIETRRKRLRAWEAVTPSFQKKYTDELLPLEQAERALRVKLAYRLDEACSQKGLTKTERHMVSELITDLAGDLIGACGDAQLKAIYNNHSRSDYDAEMAAELQEMRSALEAVLGVELGDDIDMSSPDDMLLRAQETLQAQWEQETAESQARQERRAKRKQSAKQLAAQERKDEAQAQQSLSIREVYRKLASALHPDREPDPQERERKTELMQRVNQAYGKRDLLHLLELQLELEHIDQRAMNALSEDRLKHYNEILKEQLGELDREIQRVEAGFRQSYAFSPIARISPDTVMRSLEHEIADMREDIAELEHDLTALADTKMLKGWLKGLKRRQAAIRFDELLF